MQAAALRQLSERLGASSGRRPFKRGKRREDQLRIEKFKTPLEHKPRPPTRPRPRKGSGLALKQRQGDRQRILKAHRRQLAGDRADLRR